MYNIVSDDNSSEFVGDMCKLLHEQVGIKLFLVGVLDAFTNCNPNLSGDDLKQIAECFNKVINIVEAQ